MKRFMTTTLTGVVATTIALGTLTGSAHADPPEKLLPTLKRFDFAALVVPVDKPQFFSTDIMLDGDAHTIDFERVSVFAPNAKIVAIGENGERTEMAPMEPNTYRGTVRALPGSVVTAALEDDGLHAIIRMPNHTQREVTPLDGMGVHAVYRSSDVESPPLVCDQPPVNPAWEQFKRDQKPPRKVLDLDPGLAGGGGTSNVTALIGVDCDFEYYEEFGSSVASVQGEVGKIINNINAAYEAAGNITHVISIIVIRTSSNDPYVSTDGPTINQEHRDEWVLSFQLVPYDVSLLLTNKDAVSPTSGDGLAGRALGIGEVCDRTRAFCFAEQKDSDGTQAELVAHELGHLWNLRHCNSSGDSADARASEWVGESCDGASPF
ncbi:MAG: M12 family metallo-peptidase, partial [Planctomycetota bacterium]